ncbi:hypothetical protein [Sandaracinus amylolyticus]|uniref:Lipoprotein n=1 Tax=Sandaracinus amylolyticus TaxID=927083 RepID=A0A0F6YMB1_9BACT|nr:hypothetical protein [Sandaracinus amylolyticus]AKF11235.1 hypothetical protein DB32_008384 [Sandaracinus amylolyticus]
MKTSSMSFVRNARRALVALGLVSLPVVTSGCFSHAVRVEPISVAPVQVTMDVNLHVDDERAAAEPGDAAQPSTEQATTATPDEG